MLELHWTSAPPSPPAVAAGQLLAVGVPARGDEDAKELAAHLADTLRDPIAAAIEAARFRGKDTDAFSYSRAAEGGLVQVKLLGMGDDPTSAASLRGLAFRAGRAAIEAGVARLELALPEGLSIDDPARAGALIAQGLELSTYRYDRYLHGDAAAPIQLTAVTIHAPGLDAGAEGLARGQIVARCIAQARDLGNGPAELITPTALADEARDIARRHTEAGVSVTILDRDACAARNMGLFLAVAKGSDTPPQFIHLSYTPPGESRGRVVLVGKGVTFDSGGYSLKPSDAMLEMKLDMCGAAAVLAAFEGAVELGVAYEVHALVAATENMVSGGAYRLGDVYTASDGTTVEINNTDAEGRLTLADALIYGAKLEPDLMLDFATLTGACMVALGPKIAGVMSPQDDAADAWLACAARAGEDMWRLPLPEDLNEQLDSKIADLKNTGERWGGALTAGLFLSRFTKGQRWIHVDIAGPAMAAKDWGVHRAGGTGFAVASILEMLSSERLP